MKKRINFGKVDFNKTGRRVNLVEIDIEFKNDELSICGAIWNATKTDCFTCGQCLDTIKEYLPTNKAFAEIYNLWKNYHLNGMNAGTHRQREALDKFHAESGTRWDYEKDCEYLKSIGLYEDDLTDGEEFEVRKGYKYGTGWVKWTIPESVKTRIIEIING